MITGHSDSHKIRRDFSRAAATYDEAALLQRHIADAAWEMARNHLPQKGVALDIGCGTGYFGKALFPSNLHTRLCQIDIAEGMCNMAAENGHPVICADAGFLPFAAQQTGFVFSSLCLQWTELEASLPEIARVLQTGGVAALTLFTGGSLSSLQKAYDVAGLKQRILPFPREAEITSLLQRQGFHILQQKTRTDELAFENFRGLLRHFRQLGAHAKHPFLPPLSPTELGALESAYPLHDSHFILEFDSLIIVAQKI